MVVAALAVPGNSATATTAAAAAAPTLARAVMIRRRLDAPTVRSDMCTPWRDGSKWTAVRRARGHRPGWVRPSRMQGQTPGRATCNAFAIDEGGAWCSGG